MIRRNRFTRSHNQYDIDFNIILRDHDRAGNAQLYMLDPKEVEKMPCAQMEQLIRNMSVDYHQALLILHITVQGM